MKILITAGGTRESIDAVRGVTNYSTGKLACAIAKKFLAANAKVTYFRGYNAATPQATGNISIVDVPNTAQLQEKLLQNLHSTKYDCVIHAMAVSDYVPFATAVADNLTNIANFAPISSTKKTSSNAPFLIVALKQQPKIINYIKQIQPNTTLVGFKLLANAQEQDLLQAAYNQISASQSDYVLANNLQDISHTKHKAILVGRNGIIAKANTKNEIAKIIYNQINEV
ncbi:MAG: hypothetical protein FWG68_00465 [Defluviitaleaceae bacterium]|nr:hypothetical protein [Defluviitaleaceae bacterium]